MRKYFIFFLILFLFVNSNLLADLGPSVDFLKVKITMKDGSEITGYVFNFTEGKFDSDAFLNFYRNRTNGLKSFEIFGNLYPIHDNGLLGGYASCIDEKKTIEITNVEKINTLPSPVNPKNFNGSLDLSKDDIDLMQKKLLFAVSVNDPSVATGEGDYYAFNFDPGLSKTQVHKILLKYIELCSAAERKKGDRSKDIELNEMNIKKSLGRGKIFFYYLGGD
jgi:hypothetical protein